MRLKIDENLSGSIASLFRTSGHDVVTVGEQLMIGSPDAKLAGVCADEQRVLVTLELDLANPIVFPPKNYRGIVVLRPGVRLTAALILETAQTFAGALAAGNNPDRMLWIVQPGRVRVFDAGAAL
ncbi:MAG: DUF5615 family PIN-like protein [Phycisphaerales bacterium]|nr:DUF5615 family PIN-like protein [Phycisphaerales bacterium]